MELSYLPPLASWMCLPIRCRFENNTSIKTRKHYDNKEIKYLDFKLPGSLLKSDTRGLKIWITS